MPVHYSPSTPSYRVESLEEVTPSFRMPEEQRSGLDRRTSIPESTRSPIDAQFGLETPPIASRLLYDVLHRCDAPEAFDRSSW